MRGIGGFLDRYNSDRGVCVGGGVGGSSMVLDMMNDCEWLNSAVSLVVVVFTGESRHTRIVIYYYNIM